MIIRTGKQGPIGLPGLGGGIVRTPTFAQSPYTVLPTDAVLLVNATNGPVMLQFPTASSLTPQLLRVKKTDVTANAVSCVPSLDETVEGEAASYDSTTPGEFMSFVSDGVGAWHRVG
jgi:hypothetical protein